MGIVALREMEEQTSEEEQKHPLWDSTAKPSCSTSLHTPGMSNVPKVSSPNELGQVTLVTLPHNLTVLKMLVEKCSYLYGNPNGHME
jgi:hypothetical protein